MDYIDKVATTAGCQKGYNQLACQLQQQGNCLPKATIIWLSIEA